MDDRKRTIAAVGIIVGVIVLVVFLSGLLIRGKSLITPLPDEPAIKIIFISPTIPRLPTIATPSSTLVPTKKAVPTATKRPASPTAKTTTPTPSKPMTTTPTVKASPSPTVKPTSSPTPTP